MTARNRYVIVIGTGGLGTGMMLQLDGNATLGREESRAARILDREDRCKLQIITHYIAQLAGHDLRVLPIGSVGADPAGSLVVEELGRTGQDMTHVHVDHSHPTLMSICYLYPNGDGGNITISGSASDHVSANDILGAEPLFRNHAGRGIALAAPEVPLSARLELLKVASAHGFLRFASFLTEEIRSVTATGALSYVDVLAINIDEARALTELDSRADPDLVVAGAHGVLRQANAELNFVITAGRHGSWVWDGAQLHFQPPLRVNAVNSAGAGDAHLGGLIVGTACGLSLVEANEFASTLSACSVTTQDTINTDVTISTLRRFAEEHGRSLPAAVAALEVGAE